MRSFLGSFKQLSASLPNYAAVIHDLEQVVASRSSAERLTWTPQLETAFKNAQDLAAHPHGITEPRPQDQLYTFSDYSADKRAVGGRLVIHRKMADGSIKELIGGFFSVVLDKHKQSWLPCEGEACGIRLVLEHFQNQIRESDNTTIHYTDSQPCVLAWKRSCRGAFSASSRISAFLTGLSVLPIELRHKPGKDMMTSDFASRNPNKCMSKKCQICSFVEEWQHIGDNASKIRSLTIEDIKSGTAVMPLTQPKVWKNIQSKDPIHTKLLHLIQTRQLPESRKRKGDHTKLKLLHNLFMQGKLYVEDGLVMVKTVDGHFKGGAISVPPAMFPGIINALHVRLNHPSKGQLKALASRYFYCPGWRNVIDTVSDYCHQCAAVRTLPKVLLEDSSTPPTCFGSNFAADVIERDSQKILVLREDLTKFTRALLIPDQKKVTLKNALLSMLLDIIPDTGTEVRLDAAPSFQALEVESLATDSLLHKMGIRLVLGRTLNKNKNPIAENTVKEIEKEILRHKQAPGPITDIDLILVLKNINSRVRLNGMSAKEMFYRRDLLTNKPNNANDDLIISKQSAARESSSVSSYKHKAKFKKPTPDQSFFIGDLVMLREGASKSKPRETYIIDSLPTSDCKYFLIHKLSQSLRPKLYKALAQELMPAPHGKPLRDKPPPRKSAKKAKENLKRCFALEASQNRKKPANESRFKHGWIEEDQSVDFDLFENLPQIQLEPIPAP